MYNILSIILWRKLTIVSIPEVLGSIVIVQFVIGLIVGCGIYVAQLIGVTFSKVMLGLFSILVTIFLSVFFVYGMWEVAAVSVISCLFGACILLSILLLFTYRRNNMSLK